MCNSYGLGIERGFLRLGGGGRKNSKNKEMCVLNEAVTFGKHATVEKHVSNDDVVCKNTDDTSSIAVKIKDIEFKMLEGKLVLVVDDEIPFKPLNESTAMDPFPCFSDMFGTPNTSAKVATTSTSDTPTTNGSNTGMESMLDNGPWLICNMPLVLRKWSPLVNVAKEDIKSVPFWAKFYDAPVTAFTKDGLSAIVTKLGAPLMQCLKLKVMDIYSILFEFSMGGNQLDFQIIDKRQAKQKDTNSSKVSTNNNFCSIAMVNVASSSGTKIVTSNPFDVLYMVDNNIRVAPSDLVNSKSDDVNALKIFGACVGAYLAHSQRPFTLDNEDNDTENNVEEDNETASFMASKSSEGICSSKSRGGTGKKSLCERWKDDYDDNPYEDDHEYEDLTKDQPGLCDSYDISLSGQIRR
uniref:Uncharacterized protein n=1 Tax=Tanacetum cinerariifolium TaxID=118510 RepID=A0A6L2P3D3_TANCI|nr:hypothetical protein [Tanacetum cinerariifolium]